MDNLQSFDLNEIVSQRNALTELSNKVVLLVNVASECGYTPQYSGLERLHRELAAERFTVLGVPCNQFGEQEPWSDAEIQAFCSSRYEVTFPMTTKVDVKGPGQHPLFAWLTGTAQGYPGDVAWNFEKFLIGRDGQLRARYPSGTAPEDKGLLQDIADALAD